MRDFFLLSKTAYFPIYPVRMKKVVLIFCLFVSKISGSLPIGVFNISLDAKGHHNLYWSVDYVQKEIKFESHVMLKKDEWFALGFSNRGDHESADYCVIYPEDDGQLKIADISTDDKCLVNFDKEQNCKNFAYKITPYLTIISFTRAFDTCDKDDYVIQEDTTHIVWAIGVIFQYKRRICDQIGKGMVRTQLLKNIQPNPQLPPTTWSYLAAVPQVHVPDTDTTYWCHLVKLPNQLEQKHHIVKFEPVIQKGNEAVVHHMILFHCETDYEDQVLPSYSGRCDKKPKSLEVCKKVMALWTLGISPFYFPQEAGLLVGGEKYSKYAMLEVHYNNPTLKSDWVDSSGMRIYLTTNFRQYDAGIIELGLEYTDKMAIPPYQKEFTLSSYCITECTAVALPINGIKIFASQLHTHLAGVKVETSHIRNGIEISKLNYDYHYSWLFQEIRLLRKPHYIYPGDALITTCTYNTEDRNNITLGGFASTDEMCLNYIYYYPKIDLETCQSSISDNYLKEYFNNLNKLELQNTSGEMPISESYNNIDWNPLRVRVLHNLYQKSPINMHCNRSNGHSYPGNWENMPLTRVKTLLPVEESDCDKKDALIYILMMS